MKRLMALLLSLSLLNVNIVYAAVDTSPYKAVLQLPSLNLTEPRVIELSLPANTTRASLLVVGNESLEAQPFQTKEQAIQSTPFTVTTDQGSGFLLTDDNSQTYVDYPLETEGFNEATITITLDKMTSLSGVSLDFSDFSRSPSYIRLHSVKTDGATSLILGQTNFTSPTVRFPIVALDNLVITLIYSQPIRLEEIRLSEDQRTTSAATLLRFLAKPGESYSIYVEPDRRPTAVTPREGNLFSEQDPLKIAQPTLKVNPAYKASDKDSDTIPDSQDNCPTLSNKDQSDSNNDMTGDVCEDTDFDQTYNVEDNCPEDPNFDQRDVDGDGIGDVCDAQESRFTEQYPWLPWAAMGGTVVVIAALVLQMTRNKAFIESATNQTPPTDKLEPKG